MPTLYLISTHIVCFHVFHVINFILFINLGCFMTVNVDRQVHAACKEIVENLNDVLSLFSVTIIECYHY